MKLFRHFHRVKRSKISVFGKFDFFLSETVDLQGLREFFFVQKMKSLRKALTFNELRRAAGARRLSRWLRVT